MRTTIAAIMLWLTFTPTTSVYGAQHQDFVSTWALNAPTLDCFRSFSTYYLKRYKTEYVDATITCTTTGAFITYARKHHYL